MTRYIDIHTHKKQSNENVFSLQNISPEKFIQLPDSEKRYFSVGIHPWYINATVEEQINTLKQIASHPAILAIGETGLDKICEVDFDLQKEVFNAHISIAKAVKKPLIIHCVKAYNDVLQLLKETRTNVPILFHGFRGKPPLAKELTNTDYYLSFGRFFNEESLKETPFNRIFLETDDKEIEIEQVYKLVAEVKEVSVEELIEVIKGNFEECFGRILL